MGKWSTREIGHLKMILERYQSHSIYDMAKLAHQTIKKRSVNGIGHKLRELVTEQEFKEDRLEINGVVYPAEVISGYVIITLPDGTKTPAHIFVWEQEFGEVPEGYHIHHRNGLRSDNRLCNLGSMIADDHLRMHLSGKPPETFALFCFLQERGLWKDYLTYRGRVLEMIAGELEDGKA
jgi:hypothetical protein